MYYDDLFQLKIELYKWVMVPLCMEHHWVLLTVDIESRTLYLLVSLGLHGVDQGAGQRHENF